MKDKDRPVASDLLSLLENRHSGDVFVAECKDGPTHGGSHRRMDAWSMSKSWASPLINAYEIKVSRSDFLNDSKCQEYAKYCNQLWFVCPSGMISVEEVPKNMGLLWASKTMTRLYAKKKAPYRNTRPTDLEDVFRYILMSRVQITREYGYSDSSEYWTEWLTRKREDQDLGRRVSKTISALVSERINNVNSENRHLTRVNASYEKLAKFLEENGTSIDDFRVSTHIESLVAGEIPTDLLHGLDGVVRAVEECKSRFERRNAE